jgi:hypothetical protein
VWTIMTKRDVRVHSPWRGESFDAAAAVVNDRGASVTDRRRSLTWAQRLKRAFAIEIETCRACGGRLRVIASIEAPAVIERILEHLGRDTESVDPAHPGRTPPQGDLSL